MPHSTQASADSRQTFDLTSDDHDEQPMTPQTNGALAHDLMGDRSGPYGVALSSVSPGIPQRDPRRDSREDLPSQRTSAITTTTQRRKSMPDAYAYQDLIKNGVNIDNAPLPQRPAIDNMRTYSYNEASKRRAQYYEEQFQYKDGAVGPAKERVQKQSPILAELKTNVIIKDEFTLVTDLSHHLAQRYTRPDSAIMVKIDHSACIAMGGSFEPCYILTIHAVPSQMGPSTNKRNAALIQQFMAEILSVPADRGLVTFVAIPEENYATNGNTVLGEIERVEKQDPGSVKRALNDAARKSMTFNKKSISRADTDAYGNGAVVPSEKERASPIPRQSTPSAVNKPSSLHESTLADAEQIERPRTAHGSFAAENGLRMNGVSTEQLIGKNSRTPNGRPKTFAGPSSAADLQPDPMPMPARQSIQPALKRHSQVQPQRSKHTPIQSKMTGNHVPLAPRPVQVQPNPSNTASVTSVTRVTTSKAALPQGGTETRTRNTYLDNVSTLTTKNEVPAVKVTDDDARSSKSHLRDTAANTAKRRSTVTATPKMPNLPVPPIPPEDSKSMTSRLGKRKSFMKMFKRESAPAWYK